MTALLLLASVIAQPGLEYRQPQAAALGATVAVTFGSGNTVFSTISKDGGKSFSAPVKVSANGMLSLGMHRGPRVALTGQAIVISAISGEKGRGQDGDLLSWRSIDGGSSWKGPVRVNDEYGSAREGLHSMSAGGGLVFATWLDLRTKGTKLYGSVSRDGGATWSRNVLVYESPGGSICECCHPSAVISQSGAIYVMFRNSISGRRDMYIVKSTDRGKSFGPAIKLGTESWVLNACPMDGGAIAVGTADSVETAWRRNKEIYAASATQPEQQLGSGKDASIAIVPAGKYVAWSAPEGLVLLRPNTKAPTVIDPEGRYIQLINARDKILAVWERHGAIVVEPL